MIERKQQRLYFAIGVRSSIVMPTFSKTSKLLKLWFSCLESQISNLRKITRDGYAGDSPRTQRKHPYLFGSQSQHPKDE
jgi:hypothetical protein